MATPPQAQTAAHTQAQEAKATSVEEEDEAPAVQRAKA